jgi:hypothetical protein
MNEALMKARNFVDRRDEERDKLRQDSQPIFASFAQESRSFFSFTATTSATIGAFSFLLFDSHILKSPVLLKFGDVLLLIVIVLSAYSYLSDLQKDYIRYHNDYFNTFEMLSKDISKGYKVLSGEMTFEEFKKWANEQLQITKYKRPPMSGFILHWIVFVFFVLALLLVATSLLICF